MAESIAPIDLTPDLIRSLVFETFGLRRFTQDSPINADVWVRFLNLARWRLNAPGERSGVIESYRVPLILTPKQTMDSEGTPAGHAGLLARKIRKAINGGKTPTEAQLESMAYFRIAATSRHVAIDATFYDLLSYLLPLCDWWRKLPPVELEEQKKLMARELNKGTPIPQIITMLPNTEAYRFAALATIVYGLLTKTVEDLDLAGIMRVIAPTHSPNEDMKLDQELFGSMGRKPSPAETESNLRFFVWLDGTYAELVSQTDMNRKIPEKGGINGGKNTSIWKIHLNRPAIRQASSPKPLAGKTADRIDNSSIITIKADAARRLFNIGTANLCWAVIDTGIDATHPAFHDPADPGKTRVVATLDFTMLQEILSAREGMLDEISKKIELEIREDDKELRAAKARRRINQLSNDLKTLRQHVTRGHQIDWGLVERIITIDPKDATVPSDQHGTHVAGIIGGNIPAPSTMSAAGKKHVSLKNAAERFGPFEGVCPDIRFYDLRVLGNAVSEQGKAERVKSDEFVILAALDYIAWKNSDPIRPVIHGVNISLAIPFAVGAHACGHTPVCDACDRLVWNGTVVVAAAGNSGFDESDFLSGLGIGYRDISITDPGNANEVITVGSTHFCEPHTYGVSYFSGRGPTGDGRMKPDIVAPGHKIYSTVPGDEMAVLDGTSMAAPHISGVCALIMGRHTELMGEPERIKKILMNTATDLGRERHFQGAGLVDALRALQSV